ncbi:MAG: succinyl-diaminopimelate desuccinylase [Rhizobiales bacterium]|nr:succinyl-diaminopimelate desuccinylase [Hyphomicrobiales bacterium]
MVTPPDPVELARELVRCASVTPEEGGAISLLEKVLGAAGFRCRRLRFEAPGTAAVENLFARIGTGGPHICFAGHTDVVPPGDPASWRHPPFAGVIEDGVLHGRGVADMKGAIAAFVAAALARTGQQGGLGTGSISFLITGDEEGPAVNGTVKVLEWMAANGQVPDHAVVGEPTNPREIGDEIKIGRRGSVTGRLVVTGRQGHVAYPRLAANPVPAMLAALGALTGTPLDAGNAHFEPSNLEVTTVDVGNATENVIPERIRATFNVRFNDLHTQASLRVLLAERVRRVLEGRDVSHDLTFSGSAESFLTSPGPLVDCMAGAVEAVTGRKPRLSTAGGTSDARFIKDYCPVIEMGLINQTMHQVDERMAVARIAELRDVYSAFLDRYFLTIPGA